MQRDEKHVGIIDEGLLRAVSVVNVPIDDGHPFDPARARMARRERNVVEQAKPHPSIRTSVMPWRSQQRQPFGYLSRAEQRIYQRKRPSSRAIGCCDRTRREIRVVVERSKQAVVALEQLDIGFVVDAQNFVRLGVAGALSDELDAACAARLNGSPGCHEALGALRVIAPCPMFVEQGVIHEGQPWRTRFIELVRRGHGFLISVRRPFA